MHTPVNTIYAYEDINGYCPYEDWLAQLKDTSGTAAILSRVDRMEIGNFGKSRSVGGGVYELKIYCGPGYRIYYAQEHINVYILLCGGDKKTQQNDIALAKKYWSQHKAGR